MKLAIRFFSFLLSFGLVVFVSSYRSNDVEGGKTRERTDQQKDCDCESTSMVEKFPYANHIDPEEYRRIYSAIQEMPSEDQIAGTKPKGLRSASVNTVQWESFGPLGVPDKSNPAGDQIFGRIRTMRWYYNSGNGSWERYLGAGTGGLWYGQSVFTSVIWQSLGDNLPNPSVSAIAIDPTDRNTIFVGTGDWGRDWGAGIYKTTDRGKTWKFVWTPYAHYTTQIQYLVGNSIMIAAGDLGVYRSTDGGVSWAQRTVEPTKPSAGCFNLIAASASRLYASLPGLGVYASNDGGNTWFKASAGLPTLSGSTIAIDFCMANSEVLYAAYTDTSDNVGGIYKSTNSGTSWTPTSPPPAYMVNGQGFHTNVIRVNPTNPNTVYAASVGFIKSTDGGNTWTNPVGGHPDHTTIEFDPNNSNLMYLCSDGGITLRDDGANTISNANYRFEPAAPLQVYEMDEGYSESNLIVAGTQDNGNIISPNASQPGSQWIEISGCDGGNNLNIDPYNSQTIYGNQWCGTNSPRWRTTNQGWSFDDIDNGLPNGPYSPVRFARGGAKVLWTISPSGLYNSYNGGDLWLASTTTGGNDFPGPYPWPALTVNNWATISNKVCYVVWLHINGETKTLHNYILEGTPGAMVKTDLPYVYDRLVPDMGIADEVFGLKPGLIHKSTNHGHTWTDISDYGINRIPFGLPINDVLELASGGAMYAATTMGIFKSLDGGANWFSFQNGLPTVSVSKISYVPGIDLDTLRIATYGRGFWQRLIDDVKPDHNVALTPSGIVYDFAGRDGVIFGGLSHGLGIKSTDAGNTWNQFDFGTTKDINAMGALGDQTVIAAGDSGMVFRSTDAGTTWNPTILPTSGNITGMSITAGGNAWMCASDGSLLKSTNAGLEWLEQTPMSGIIFRSMQFIDEMNGMLLGKTTIGASLPLVYVTTNGGELWMPTYPPTTNDLRKLFFTSDFSGYAVGDSGTIVKTTDAGTSWTTLMSGTSVNLFSCFFSDAMTGWAVGDSGTMLKTNDGGESWQRAASGTTRSFHSVTMSSMNTLFGGDSIVYNLPKLHQNTVHFDIRKGWNLVSLPIGVGDSSVASLFPSKSSNAFLFGGGGYANSATMSSGTGYWVKFNGDHVTQMSGPPKGTLTIPVTTGWNLIGSTAFPIATSSIVGSVAGMSTSPFFTDEGSYIITPMLQPGKAYWVKVNQAGTLTLGPMSVNQPRTGRISIIDRGEFPPTPPNGEDPKASPQTPYEFALDQSYPNPFNASTNFRFTLPAESNVRLEVLNTLGEKVALLVDGVLNPGVHQQSWNAANVASGLYFYKLEATDMSDRKNNFVKVGKMLLIK